MTNEQWGQFAGSLFAVVVGVLLAYEGIRAIRLGRTRVCRCRFMHGRTLRPWNPPFPKTREGTPIRFWWEVSILLTVAILMLLIVCVGLVNNFLRISN